MQVTPGPSSITSSELGLREPANYDDPLATATAVSNSPRPSPGGWCLSPGGWCLPPASKKLCHLLACKRYEISDPSQVSILLRKAGTVLLIGAYEPKKQFLPSRNSKSSRRAAVRSAVAGPCFERRCHPIQDK